MAIGHHQQPEQQLGVQVPQGKLALVIRDRLFLAVPVARGSEEANASARRRRADEDLRPDDRPALLIRNGARQMQAAGVCRSFLRAQRECRHG